MLDQEVKVMKDEYTSIYNSALTNYMNAIKNIIDFTYLPFDKNYFKHKINLYLVGKLDELYIREAKTLSGYTDTIMIQADKDQIGYAILGMPDKHSGIYLGFLIELEKNIGQIPHKDIDYNNDHVFLITMTKFNKEKIENKRTDILLYYSHKLKHIFLDYRNIDTFINNMLDNIAKKYNIIKCPLLDIQDKMLNLEERLRKRYGVDKLLIPPDLQSVPAIRDHIKELNRDNILEWSLKYNVSFATISRIFVYSNKVNKPDRRIFDKICKLLDMKISKIDLRKEIKKDDYQKRKVIY